MSRTQAHYETLLLTLLVACLITDVLVIPALFSLTLAAICSATHILALAEMPLPHFIPDGYQDE